jgi:arabinogalactan oligomer/maltooligosaccharide transport system permease protein
MAIGADETIINDVAKGESGKKVRRRDQRSPLASFGLHFGLFIALIWSLVPPIWALLTSLKPNDQAITTELKVFVDPSLNNYTYVLTETDLPRWFLNSVIVAAFTMVIGLFLSATAGYAVSRFRFPGHKSLMWSFLITQMFPMAILIVPIYNIFARLGLLNNLWGLVIAYCTTAVPFCAWMLKGYFDTIPIEIDEAGRIDGLTPFGTFYRLVLPLARPGLAVTAFYTFLTAWGEVAYATAFLTSDSKKTLAVGLQTFVGQFKTEWGYLTAAGILVTIPAVIVFLLVQRNLVAGLTAGGTKG